MNFFKRWLILAIVGTIVTAVLATIFFDYTWMDSRSDIPSGSLCVGIVFGFLFAIKSND